MTPETVEHIVFAAILAVCAIVLVLMAVKYIRLKQKHEKTIMRLEGEVYRDELTGLFNRRYFTEQVNAQLTRASRSGTPATLIMLDIDHFKRVNDTYGHLAGDAVLKGFADQLKNAVRGYDIVVRHGGEEFAVYMPDVDGKTAKVTAERIRRNVENSSCVFEDYEIKITCSLGIAAVASGYATAAELIDLADKAMYEAKVTGRNRICMAPPIVRNEDPQVAEFRKKHEKRNKSTVRLDILARVFSGSLDVVERNFTDIREHHSMRVAALCAAMGRKLSYNEDAIASLTICALFHDNSLTEYMLTIRRLEDNADVMREHCEIGQKNVDWLPFKKAADGYVKYHHERADGSGPFGLKKGEYPREAGLISIADYVDIRQPINTMEASDLPKLWDFIDGLTEKGYDAEDTQLLKSVINEDMLAALKDGNIDVTVDSAVPIWTANVSDKSVIRIASMIASVVDHISEYKLAHSTSVANMAWLMGEHYGFDKITQHKLYLSACLHDIGMVTVPQKIIDKRGDVTEEEYEILKSHVTNAREWFVGAPNFKDIENWAFNHHEKLDGSGYDIGMKGDILDKCSRLIACIDVFDGISSKRPYHDSRGFAETFVILDQMVADGQIDAEITADLKTVLMPYEGKEFPPPKVG